MKKLLVIFMALAMIVSMLAAFPFAVSADEGEGEVGAGAASPVWSGKANIKWYLDVIAENPEAKEFHIKTAEDFAGLAYLVNGYFYEYTTTDNNVETKHSSCYNALWYDLETGDVLGFSISGYEAEYAFNYTKLGFYIPASLENFNPANGQYIPDYDDDMEPIGCATVSGRSFEYTTIYLDNDIVLNTGNAADWATEAPQNVWMPIGGGRSTSATPYFFNGTFKGQGHTISGLYFSTDNSSLFACGLFGYVGRGRSASIQDLVLENSYICGGVTVGAVVGRVSASTTLTNCHVRNAIIKSLSSEAAGIVGAAHGGSVMMSQCSAVGVSIESLKAVGGLLGSLNFQDAYFMDCLVQGTVRAYTVSKGEAGGTTGGWDVGGLIGRVAQGSITASHVIADVELIQEANDFGSEGSSYTASAGIVYGAAGKRLSTEESRYPAPQLTIECLYYVDKINSASGEVLEFKSALPIAENMLCGAKPKASLNVLGINGSTNGFDFEEIWNYGSKNTEDSLAAQLPQLRNVGKTTDEEGGEEDPGIVDPHTYGKLIKAQKATCTEDGVEAHYFCEHCKGYFNADRQPVTLAELTIPATGHKLVWKEEKAATEEADGEKAHYECSVCHKYFDESEKEVTKADITIPKIEKKGCFGVVAGVPFVAVVVFGAALLIRKKENEEK